MLTAVKNQAKVSLKTIKYALQREMLNKFTFISNIIFMILNNAGFIVQWIILYSIKDNVGGYTLKQIMLLWGIAAGTYGFSHFFFKDAYELTDNITTGKLDAYLIQPKNVLISSITSSVEVSALGDLIYGYIMLFVFGFSIRIFLLFTLFITTGGIILTCVAVIYASLAFWFGNVEIIATTSSSLMTSFATYPDGIFKGAIKIFFCTIIPISFVNYIPVKIISSFNLLQLGLILLVTIIFVIITFLIFNKGLKRYSSSNLMNTRI